MYNEEIMNTAISDLDNNVLEQHGILGMKWGVRRFQPYPKGNKKGKEVGEAIRKAGSKTFSVAKSVHEKRKVKKIAKKAEDASKLDEKDISKMSDEEIKKATEQLQARIKRVDAEKRLSDLQKEYESKSMTERKKKNSEFRQKVLKDVKDVTYDNAKDIFKQLEKSGMVKVINDAMNDMYDEANNTPSYEDTKRRELSKKYMKDVDSEIDKFVNPGTTGTIRGKEKVRTREQQNEYNEYIKNPNAYRLDKYKLYDQKIDEEIELDKRRNPDRYIAKKKKQRFEPVAANNKKK